MFEARKEIPHESAWVLVVMIIVITVLHALQIAGRNSAHQKSAKAAVHFSSSGKF